MLGRCRNGSAPHHVNILRIAILSTLTSTSITPYLQYALVLLNIGLGLTLKKCRVER